MAEIIVRGYHRLFEVHILHHYWLDYGGIIFDNLPENEIELGSLPLAQRQRPTRERQLREYDVSDFLEINPASSTEDKLKGLNGIFKKTATGFLVAVPGEKEIKDDEIFEFFITVKRDDFIRYTAMTLMSSKVREIFFAPEKKIYRYKENVPVFSNLPGTARGVGTERNLFISAEIPAPGSDDEIEFLNIRQGELVQLTSSEPGAARQKIGTRAVDLPVFFNQNDYPKITPPPGLTGAPEKGILLNDEIPDNVFGLIRIAAINSDDADFSCTEGKLARLNAPVFQIRFKSRSAFWRYLNSSTSVISSESSVPLPFTFNGNASESGRKPSNLSVNAEFENDDPEKRIEKLYTEIFE